MSCSICGGSEYARGLCQKHYRRFLRNGSTERVRFGHGTLEERFLSRLLGLPSRTTEECWEWPGGRTGKGYGVIQEGRSGSRLLLTHRVSYQIHKGAIPPGMLVLHSCDNRCCVNPAHLRAGTQSENIKEAFEKGRKSNPIAHGEANPRSKLTLVQAKFIKANPGLTLTHLAELFGLSLNCIRGVRIGRTWKDA